MLTARQKKRKRKKKKESDESTVIPFLSVASGMLTEIIDRWPLCGGPQCYVEEWMEVLFGVCFPQKQKIAVVKF